MSIKQAKCENCGGKLEYNENKNLFCPNCGSTYLDKEDINNVYVNNNITKNYFGSEVKKAINDDKIQGLLLQATRSIYSANYSEARNYCISVIEKDPYNWCATIFKGFIENVAKQENGRYIKSFTEREFFSLLEYISNDDNLSKYYDIFPYCKLLLENLAVLPSTAIIELSEKYISIFNKIDNVYAKEFVTTLKSFKSGVQETYERMISDQAEEEQLKTIFYSFERKNKYLKFGLIATIILAIILFIVALK